MIIFLLITIILMRVVQSIYNKRASLNIPEGARSYMKYIGINKLFAAMFSLVFVIVDKSFI